MGRTCSKCGLDNTAGRIVCHHCHASLLGTVPGISDKNTVQLTASWRRWISLLGAIVVPILVLVVYGILAGNRVFLDLPTDRPMLFFSALVGMPFVLLLPLSVWVRVLAVVVYVPVILVVLVIVALYIACSYGRCV